MSFVNNNWFSAFGHTNRRSRRTLEQLTSLECRALLSAKSGPDLSKKSIRAAVGADDSFEENDTLQTANNRGAITTNTKINGVLLDDDWFKFTLKAPGGQDDYVSLSFEHDLGDIDMYLYTGKGRYVTGSFSTSDWERISLDGLQAGNYYVELVGFRGATNPSYQLEIEPGGDDRFENNDSVKKATVLGNIQGSRTLTNLALFDADYFQFTLTETGAPTSFVGAGFNSLRGDIDMTLYNKAGKAIKQSNSGDDQERISLAGLPAGTYTVGLAGFEGQVNSSYDLTIAAPTGNADGEHTLYLNFDGYEISTSDLFEWSHFGADWEPNGFSPDVFVRPISVSPFLNFISQREQVINQITQMVAADLAPFGIQVVRSLGGAWEDQFSTTIFLGPSTSYYPHIANDIDFGNINRTDIAFVGDEVWEDLNRTAIAMADVVLHEAGHTFGLFHVQSGSATETMGLRYNTPESQWVQDTSFLDQDFAVLPGHGPDGYIQNSFQYMLSTFGSGTTAAASIVSNPTTAVNWVYADPRKARSESILGI